MTAVAVALVAVLAVTVVSFTGLLRHLFRQHARECDLLIAQLLHATGKPWQEAPAETERRADRLADELRERDGARNVWVSPEQRPVE